MKLSDNYFLDKKDAYYFSHDANSRHDPKIQFMRTFYGSEGYGWFWILIELLRNEKEYKLELTENYFYDFLSKELDTDKKKAKKFLSDCIKKFKLFESDEKYFWNKSLINRMKYKEAKSLKAQTAANKRWGKNNSMQPHSKCSPIKGKEIKVNETKVKGNRKRNISRNDKSFRLASKLLSSIKSFYPEFKEPNLEKWSQEIDDMIRLDKRNLLDIELVIKLLPDFEHWRKFVMTPKSLRRNFDQLYVACDLNNYDEASKRFLLNWEITEKYRSALERLSDEENDETVIIN